MATKDKRRGSDPFRMLIGMMIMFGGMSGYEFGGAHLWSTAFCMIAGLLCFVSGVFNWQASRRVAPNSSERPSIEEIGVGDAAWGIAKQALDEKWSDAKLGPAIAQFAIKYAAELVAHSRAEAESAALALNNRTEPGSGPRRENKS